MQYHDNAKLSTTQTDVTVAIPLFKGTILSYF